MPGWKRFSVGLIKLWNRKRIVMILNSPVIVQFIFTVNRYAYLLDRLSFKPMVKLYHYINIIYRNLQIGRLRSIYSISG